MARTESFTDEKLLLLLEENSKAPYREIGEQLGVTETAVRKRVKKLLSEGIIERFTVKLNHEKLGIEHYAFIGVDTIPEKFLTVQATLKDLPASRAIWATSGDHDILVEAWFEIYEDIQVFTDEIEQIEGVTRVCPAVVSKKIMDKRGGF